MEDKEIYTLVIAILHASLNQTELSSDVKAQISDETIKPIYLLAKKHRLTQVISSVICENEIELNPDILNKLQKNELRSAHKLEQMKYTFSRQKWTDSPRYVFPERKRISFPTH